MSRSFKTNERPKGKFCESKSWAIVLLAIAPDDCSDDMCFRCICQNLFAAAYLAIDQLMNYQERVMATIGDREPDWVLNQFAIRCIQDAAVQIVRRVSQDVGNCVASQSDIASNS
jgi:hypothetical protein